MAMSGVERKVALIRAGITQSTLAARCWVTEGHFSAVMQGHRRSPRVEKAIADALHLPLDEVFEPVPKKTTAVA